MPELLAYMQQMVVLLGEFAYNAIVLVRSWLARNAPELLHYVRGLSIPGMLLR